MNLSTTIKLKTGYEIPMLGYGTWQSPNDEDTVNSIVTAIKTGYRHIDGAAVYGNEVSVGTGIEKSGIKREELFLTSKVWNKDKGYETTLAAFEKTLSDLKTDYLDLYLIHWPNSAHDKGNWQQKNADTWRAMEKLHKEGKIRSIGLSNFMPHHIDELLKTAEIIPAVNQIEFHPGFMQEKTVEHSKKYDMVVEGWSPLANGTVFKQELLIKLAEKYNVSISQLTLRWCLQHGVITLTKSVTESRIIENANLYNFEISAEDMSAIDKMEYFGGSGFDPDNIPF